jgi:hypothetical protein
VKTPATYDTIGPDPGRHGIETGGEDGRNANPLTLFGNRSTATCSSART